MVARLTGGEEVAGSNPVVPTILPASKRVGAAMNNLEEAVLCGGPDGSLLSISPCLNRADYRGPDIFLRREYPPAVRVDRDARPRLVRILKGLIPHGNQIPVGRRSQPLGLQ